MSDQVRPTDSPGDSAKAEQTGGHAWAVGGIVVFLVASAGALLAWLNFRREENAAPTPDPFPVPALSTSRFKNTGADAHYVGSESCVGCHKKATTSFRRTGMGRSMAEIDLAKAPADATFDHAASKRRYQVQRKGGQLWHRELLITSGPEEVVLTEYPLKYVSGSGRHALTYLVDAEGFLVESPLTWYRSKNAWDMSPGYDRAEHLGFERSVGEGCLFCHAGRSEPIGKSQFRMEVKEPAISCERCHGPGSLHVELRKKNRKGVDFPDNVDTTIVNPSHLPRALAEAVCQQCHLHSAATVMGRGRSFNDFRPGLPLTDFRQDYVVESDSKSMTVVGHVEQMHLSKCYQQSKTLTCTTCHNPHAFPKPEESVAYQNGKCATCHQPAHCKVSDARRQKESPSNNCVQCHMPSSPTDITHVAFTHHRIGIHDKPAGGKAMGHGGGTLVPFIKASQLGEVDQKRSLGLAYLELDSSDPARAMEYRKKALDLLTEAHTAGLRDPVLDARLARLHFDMRSPQARSFAETAIARQGLIGLERGSALFVLAGERSKANDHEQVRAALRELVGLRRNATDWLLLAHAEKLLGNDSAWADALQMAVRIKPGLTQAHQSLADHFRRLGDQKRAVWHQARATP